MSAELSAISDAAVSADPHLRANRQRAGEGEPLVLLHGIGSSLRVWREVVPALSTRHEVLVLDIPGFGESRPLPPGTRSTLPALVDAVEHELDAAGFERAHVVGNSLGGWIALELARRGRAWTVVGLSPAGAWTDREAAYARAVLRTVRAVAERLDPYAGPLTRTAAGRTVLLSSMAARPWRVDAHDAAYAMQAAARAPGWHETLEWTISHRMANVDRIRTPALVAWGTADRLLPPRQGRRLAGWLPAAELRELPGLGHLPMWDDPELVASATLDFISRARG